MNKYICPVCKKSSYSAAELERLVDPRCPYCHTLGIEKAAPIKNGGDNNLHLHGMRESI
jgi:hypothetical protein